jgi:glucose/arabinose dehydrogenase
VLHVTPDGRAEIVADQLNGPVTDLLWANDALYISHKTKVSRLDSSGEVRDIVTGLPSLGDHQNNQLALGPDGKLYLGQGTATNSGVVGVDNFVFGWLQEHPDFHDVPAHDLRVKKTEFASLNPFSMTLEREPALVRTAPFHAFGKSPGSEATIPGRAKASGTILRFNPDGSGLEPFAWGLRNPFGIAFDPADGQLYATENAFDDRGSRPIANAPECVWRIQRDAWYGWPDFSAGIPVTDPRFQAPSKPKPQFIMAEHPPVQKPLATRPVNAALTKCDFSRSQGFGFAGELFFGEFGDMTPATGREHGRPGYDVVRLDVRTGAAETFFRLRPEAMAQPPFDHSATAGPRRPVDVVFNPSGDALYVVDFGAMAVIPGAAPIIHPFEGTGVVWRIVRSDAPPSQEPTNISVKLPAATVPGRRADTGMLAP